jgi:3-hydroxyisobutyrate dehydrogenase
VGAGRIGLPLIANLVRAGHLVHAVDIRPEREHPATSAGARWAGASVGMLSATQVLLTVLPGSAELRAVMLGNPDADTHAGAGLLSTMPAASTWIDCTSAAPVLGAELAAAAQRRGVDYLAAPLGGGVSAAEQASLTLYVGGSAELLARHRQLLEAIADPERIRHVGGHGAGYLAKLLVNQLWFGQAVAVGEALLLGQRAGLAPAVLSEVLESSPAASRFISDYLRPLLRRRVRSRSLCRGAGCRRASGAHGGIALRGVGTGRVAASPGPSSFRAGGRRAHGSRLSGASRGSSTCGPCALSVLDRYGLRSAGRRPIGW